MEETAETTMEKLVSSLKSKSNERNSEDCEAGPLKRGKKDESRIKDVNINSLLNWLHSIDQLKVNEYPIMKDYGKFLTIYHGDANNNNIHVANTFNNLNCTRQSTNVKKDEPSIIVQRTVTKEVFPYDKDIIELIWKYLSFEDKTDCTLVCNRFNDIISNMNCFRLVVKRKRSKLQIIPTVSRDYKKLVIQEYHCKNLSPAMHKMLKHLSQSVTDLTLDCCEFDIIALCEFIRELPLLESLKLNVIITVDKNVYFCEEEFPNLLRLKNFNINVNNDKLNEILDITGSASNIQSLTLFDAIFDENLIKYLTNNKNSLTTLSITECIVDTSFMTNLNSLYFGSSVKISPVNFKSFDCLNKLRKLELININNEVLGILNKKWADQLEECTITFNYKQSFDVQRYFEEGFYDHFIFQDIEYTEYFHTIYKNQQIYFIRCFERNKKMIEYFSPLKPNPTVDDINNNMCYFKMTPITKSEDFLINRRNNSIIPSSLLQDILTAQAKECKNTIKYRDYNFKWRDYELLCKEEFQEWCAENQEWYKEYYKFYKREYESWESCHEWIEKYDEWCAVDHQWCREYSNWYREYHKCSKEYHDWDKEYDREYSYSTDDEVFFS